ncbi:MAG: tetratricopeptide repeat protein [Deltaproteobacteria bacterium]|nr:tetratricopeptide repeat protein [Deltaproteobacteria bacterium]
MSVQFCPQCGTKTLPPANFCASCGATLPSALPPAPSHQPPPATLPPSAPLTRASVFPGLLVMGFYLLAGTALWVFVLRSQPFPTVGATDSGGPSRGGSQNLAQATPPVTLPDDVKQRITEFVEKAKAAPQDANAWRTLADVQFRASQIDASYRSAALSSYHHVLELLPNDLPAIRGVGNVYYDFEEYSKAKEYYEKYLTLSPEDPDVRTDLGTMYLYAKDTDRAIKEYQTVVTQKPDFFQAYFNLGVAYHEKGDLDKARETLAKAKTLTTDKVIHERVDQVLAQFNGGPAPTSASMPPPSTPAPPTTPVAPESPVPVAIDPSLSPFQQAIEKLFRTHDIMGPRINAIEWPTPTEARILIQNFPMSAMPPDMRERFLGKFRTLISEAKTSNGISGTATVTFIDADSKQLMETLSS